MITEQDRRENEARRFKKKIRDQQKERRVNLELDRNKRFKEACAKTLLAEMNYVNSVI